MRVIRIIDRGGFGRVEEIELPDGRRVARKVFDPALHPGDDKARNKFRERFEREVRYQKSISSDAIFPIYEFELDDDSPWFTMPLAETTLAHEIERCRREGSIPVEALADVLNALEELHRLDFVHRDLKPSNILLLDGVWRLSDFGLILPPTGATTQLTSTGSAWGTPNYAAPEQAADFHSVDEAADIYAFGCILHDIFGTPPRTPFVRQTAPGPIGGIIERCTDPRPERRFKSVGSLRAALFDLLSDHDSIQPTPSAAEWIARLEDNSITDAKDVDELVRFISNEAEGRDKVAIYLAITEENLQTMFDSGSSSWSTLAISYAEWVSKAWFNFAYCDVLIHRLEKAFSLGDLKVKAEATLAAATLACTHNRWYVMGRVLKMCGPHLDELTAQRICIDIRAFGLENTFVKCARRIGQSVDLYHPLIRRTICQEAQAPASL